MKFKLGRLADYDRIKTKVDNLEDRKKLHSEYRQELLKRQLSNSENFDKAILSLSTAGLGFSLAFIKNIIHISEAHFVALLHVSWYLFAAAIILTVSSFLISQLGISKQLVYAEQYYLGGKEEFLRKKNPSATITIILNWLSGICFFTAVLITVIFVSQNLRGG